MSAEYRAFQRRREHGGGWSAAVFWEGGPIQLVLGPKRGERFETPSDAERVAAYLVERGRPEGA